MKITSNTSHTFMNGAGTKGGDSQKLPRGLEDLTRTFQSSERRIKDTPGTCKGRSGDSVQKVLGTSRTVL